jgi:hypothetical protein
MAAAADVPRAARPRLARHSTVSARAIRARTLLLTVITSLPLLFSLMQSGGELDGPGAIRAGDLGNKD